VTVSIRDSFKGLYRLCECGDINCLIPIINTQGRFSKFKKGHNQKNKNGQYNAQWKGGRVKIGDYWYLRINKRYVPEHVYFYEQKNKVCMLKWAVVHHIDPVTPTYCNNMPWNLTTMMRGEHIIFHKKGKKGMKYRSRIRVDNFNRICVICGNNRTYVPKNKSPMWYGNKIKGYFCSYCRGKIRNGLRKRRKNQLLI
jgi:hypothetical protein